jgi:hypothetical protein
MTRDMAAGPSAARCAAGPMPARSAGTEVGVVGACSSESAWRGFRRER